MHKSRLAGFIIDCRTPDIDEAAHFWSEALGYSLKASSRQKCNDWRSWVQRE
jgi:hypothetical protein